ncbi:unnamed protein product [marine sediment metagenome]|uniref:Uncharacterized protein n=1 Tax=marine sediment metagenome TaxID=412755 RepID=X0SD63_9ZZZZ
MPVGIYLYEIDESFGPNVLAEYYLDQKNSVNMEILKDFEEKHIQKEFSDTIFWNEDLRYYSAKMDAKSVERDNLFLGFVLKQDEDLVSLKSILENIAAKVVKDFSQDKNALEALLRKEFDSIFTLMEKLKEPSMVKETINDKTKKMLDDGKLSEARELIDLGEQIPEKLSEEIKLAEQQLIEGFYKKAKKSFLKAAELAETIQEVDIVSFLTSKAEQVGKFPELIKERENNLKEIENRIETLQDNKLHLYHELIKPLDTLINIANSFEEHETTTTLTEFLKNSKRADELAKELFNLDKKFKEILHEL